MGGSVGGGPVYWPYEEDLRNQEKKEPRRFKAGDRVRVNDKWVNVDDYLQEDNRIGTVVKVDSTRHYWLHMDKPVISEGEHGKVKPSIIPDGHSYYAMPSELELLESVPESQKSFDIEAWRKNLKVGDKVRVAKNPERPGYRPTFIEEMNTWKGRVVTLLKIDGEELWRIKEDQSWWAPRWFEPVEKTELGKPKKAKELKKQPLDPRLKKLIQNAQGLIQTIEKTFKDSQKYPIFGINLAKQEPVEKIKKDDLGESLLSLGVVLYHLYTGQSEHNNHSYLLDGYSKPEDMPEGFWKVVNKLLKSEYKSLDEFKEDLKQTNKDSSQEKVS